MNLGWQKIYELGMARRNKVFKKQFLKFVTVNCYCNIYIVCVYMIDILPDGSRITPMLVDRDSFSLTDPV